VVASTDEATECLLREGAARALVTQFVAPGTLNEWGSYKPFFECDLLAEHCQVGACQTLGECPIRVKESEGHTQVWSDDELGQSNPAGLKDEVQVRTYQVASDFT
jgi:hypothetical protein